MSLKNFRRVVRMPMLSTTSGLSLNIRKSPTSTFPSNAIRNPARISATMLWQPMLKMTPATPAVRLSDLASTPNLARHRKIPAAAIT